MFVISKARLIRFYFYRRMTRATILLIPLFGVQFLVTLNRPNTGDCDLEQVYYYVFYCYFNKEVRILYVRRYTALIYTHYIFSPSSRTGIFDRWEVIPCRSFIYERDLKYLPTMSIILLYLVKGISPQDLRCCLYSFIQSVFCLKTGPYPLPKRVLYTVQAIAFYFSSQYPLVSLRSSSSCLRLLPRLPIIVALLSILPSKMC